MLSNAYFLAKFRFDIAENEPAKNLQNFANFANVPNFANPNPLETAGGGPGPGANAAGPSPAARAAASRVMDGRTAASPASPQVHAATIC